MQEEAVPYKSKNSIVIDSRNGDIKEMVLRNAAIVFWRSGCDMRHVVEGLLQGLGVNLADYEVEEDNEKYVVQQLEKIVSSGDGSWKFPAVFIGGKFYGGPERIIATHISGELVPALKHAGALWL